MDESRVLASWRRGTTAALPGLLAENVVFSSPVRDYSGRRLAAHLLMLAGRALENVEFVAGWGSETERVSAFTARAGDSEVHGMVREEYDRAGAVEHVTVFLRPYDSLKVVVRRMTALLEDDPVPVDGAESP